MRYKRYFLRASDCNEAESKLKEVSGPEYFKYVNDPANQGRKFVTLGDDGEKDAGIIVIEVTSEQYRNLRNERCKAVRHQKKDPLYSLGTLSLDAPIPGYEDTCLHEVVGSYQEGVEEQALRKAEVSRFLVTLNPDEKQLVKVLYLDNSCDFSEREIARQLGIPQKTLNNRKQKLLAKLRKYFGQI